MNFQFGVHEFVKQMLNVLIYMRLFIFNYLHVFCSLLFLFITSVNLA